MKSLPLIAVTVSLVLTGCASTPPQWLTGSDRCSSIGCGKDLEFYPMAPGEAVRQAKAHGFEWGKTSSAYPPSDPKHWELKRQEEAAGQTPWHWNQDPLAK
jgi:hypothetical protein